MIGNLNVIFSQQVLVSSDNVASLVRKAAGLAILATCLLACVTSHAANPWDGKFRAVAEKNEQQTLYWNVEVQCDRHDECQGKSVLDTVFVPAMQKANQRGTPL